MEYVFFSIRIILFVWLGLSVLYILVYSLAALFYKENQSIRITQYPKIALFIPAYMEDAVILNSTKEALKHKYKGEFDVVVIADKLQNSTIRELESMPIILLEAYFDESTKSKSLNFALNKLTKEYDLAVVLDADNVLGDNFLNLMAVDFRLGSKATQGHRVAKNKNSRFAFLDAISEEVNNHIYCKGANSLNLSSRIVGSGMGVEYKLFKELMGSINAVGGFDKELELKLIDKKVKINYLEGAYVYDEKVENSNVYRKQRTRWISAQYFYLRKNFVKSIKCLKSGNIDFFLKTIQLALPPRLLLPVFLLLFAFLDAVLLNFIESGIWMFLLLSITVAYSVAIPKSFWNKHLIFSLLSIPKAAIVTVIALFCQKSGNKKFIHTPHSGNSEIN